jgi:predicted small metal-binding protein
MRAVECPCGEAIEGRNDSELFETLKRHASQEHGNQYSDIDLKLRVDTAAYDTATTGSRA